MMNFIHRWFHLDEIEDNQLILEQRLKDLHAEVIALKGQIIAANRGMGRLLAKLDPLYGKDELDPDRRAASDKLSNEIIKKLIAEHIASKGPHEA
jgi:hypothetical protein